MTVERDDTGKPTPVRTAREPFMPLALITLAPLLLWALHFALVYLLEGFLCAPPGPWMSVIPGAILAATLLGAGASAALLARGAALLRRSAAALQSLTFLQLTQRLFAILSLAAILWAGSGALLLSPCAFIY